MIDATTILILIGSLVAIVIAFVIGQKIGANRKQREWEKALPDYRKDAIQRSRFVIGGQFSEQLAPYLPNFDYLPTECKFIGKPIDFIVFRGMDEKKIDEVVFVEVKSGKSKLNAHEKNLKDTIQKKRVRWEEYRIPDELTKKGVLNFNEDGLFDEGKEV